MPEMPDTSYEHCSDEALMQLYFDLSLDANRNAGELAAIDAAMQARLLATYGAAEPGSSPRSRTAH